MCEMCDILKKYEELIKELTTANEHLKSKIEWLEEELVFRTRRN